MKPHIELKLRPGVATPDAPFWVDAIEDKTGTSVPVDREVAKLLAKYAVPVIVTRGYAPAGETWSPDEIATGLDRIYRLVLEREGSVPPQLIREISLVPTVEYARLGAIGSTEIPEPTVSALSVDTDRRSREAIHLEEAQQFTKGDPSIVVAVLDTGVWLNHTEFKDRLLPGRDFVDILDGAGKFLGDYLDADDDPTDAVGHGTHVTGILVARGAAMPKGVVPRCRILPVRVLGALKQGDRSVGAGLVDNINNAIKWAIDRGATIINMSLGVRHTGGGLPHQDVIEYARRKGVTVIAAAGNDGTEALYYPGAFPHVIAVGAVDARGEVAPFSTYGRQVSFVAPGTEIYSTFLENEYAHSTGTSHATPFVTGAAAMLKSFAKATRGIRLTDSQIKHVLKHSADRIDGRFKHPKAGFGRINLLDALKLLEHKLKTTPARRAA
jgi:subtilisin family serine protease